MRLPPYDKCLHFIGGTILAAVTVPFVGIVLSMALVTAIAVGKELWDYNHPPHQTELWDAFSTMLGGLPVWIAFGCGVIK